MDNLSPDAPDRPPHPEVKEYSSPASVGSSSSSLPPKRNPIQPFSRTLALILMAFAFGFLGGKVAELSPAKKLPSSTSISQTPGATSVVTEEDNAVIDVVDKSSPGVVSIVISKDIPKLRQFGGSSRSPFFFDPFNQSNPFGLQEPNTPGGDSSNDGGSGATGKQQIGAGSGFLVTSDGLIVTNKHVVSDPQADYTVITNDGKEHPAKVLALDPNNDVAVVKIDGNNYPFLNFGDSDKLKVGQTAIAIGNPLGQFANSVSRGIISGLARDVTAGSDFTGDVEQLKNIIQTDAAINPGNSGGPLLDLSGNVVGINVAVAAGAQNLGFAIPVNSIKKSVDQVKTTGKITTPYLGVRYVIVDEALAKQNSLPYTYGALVLRGSTMTDFAVIPGSPADKAGIVENDIILEVDGTKIDKDHTLSQLLANKNVGDTVKVKVWEKGNVKDIQVNLEARP